MIEKKKIFVTLVLLFLVFTFSAALTRAGGKEYEKIVYHLKTKYQAKKVKIPMVWLARFAVQTIRPAGVKSFSITTFENLKLSRATLDAEMHRRSKIPSAPIGALFFASVRAQENNKLICTCAKPGAASK